MDPEQGQMFSVDPFYSLDKLKASKPKYDLPKKKERTEEDNRRAAKLIDSVKHVDLYEHPDEDTYRQIISDTIEMRAEGMIAGHISKLFVMKEIQDAIEFIEKKQCTGKVLIDVKCSDDDDGCEDDKTESEKKKDD